MDAALVIALGVAGTLAGAGLDPLGQQLADESARAEAARREQRRADAAAPPDADAPDAGPEPADDPPLGDDTESGIEDLPALPHLLPQGRSPARTVGAAVASGALAAGAAARFGPHPATGVFAVFFLALVMVGATDLSHRLVPRRIVYLAGLCCAVGILFSAAWTHRWGPLAGAAISGAALFVLLFAVWWFFPKGMGFGDVRLVALIGGTVGWLSILHAYVAFAAALVIAMVFGVVSLAVTGSGRRTRIPFAPSLVAGAVVAVFWGGAIATAIFPARAS